MTNEAPLPSGDGGRIVPGRRAPTRSPTPHGPTRWYRAPAASHDQLDQAVAAAPAPPKGRGRSWRAGERAHLGDRRRRGRRAGGRGGGPGHAAHP